MISSPIRVREKGRRRRRECPSPVPRPPCPVPVPGGQVAAAAAASAARTATKAPAKGPGRMDEHRGCGDRSGLGGSSAWSSASTISPHPSSALPALVLLVSSPQCAFWPPSALTSIVHSTVITVPPYCPVGPYRRFVPPAPGAKEETGQDDRVYPAIIHHPAPHDPDSCLASGSRRTGIETSSRPVRDRMRPGTKNWAVLLILQAGPRLGGSTVSTTVRERRAASARRPGQRRPPRRPWQDEPGQVGDPRGAGGAGEMERGAVRACSHSCCPALRSP